MIAKLTKIFETPHPVQFTSPLQITECAKRLQESLGKRLGCVFASIEGQIDKIDESTYTFTLYQAYRGGHTISGKLYALTESTTQIDAVHTVDRRSWWVGLFFVGVLIVLSFFAMPSKDGLLGVLSFGSILLVMLIGIMFVSLKTQSISQLLWYFERTLKQ